MTEIDDPEERANIAARERREERRLAELAEPINVANPTNVDAPVEPSEMAATGTALGSAEAPEEQGQPMTLPIPEVTVIKTGTIEPINLTGALVSGAGLQGETSTTQKKSLWPWGKK